MNDYPLTSILIDNYNYGRFLKEAIDSALNQTYAHIEVIVVDDGSTDNSRDIIASYRDQIIPVLKSNGGQASAFNAGFAASKGDIICFLDADDIFMPDKVAEVVNALENRLDIGWCFHPLQQVDKDGKLLNPLNPHNNLLREYDLREHIKKGKLKDKLSNLTSTSGLCFRRSLLQDILPMPEAKRIGLNDGYLEFVAIGLSKGLILDKALGFYRVHGSNAYTMSQDKRVQARILIITAYWMRVKFPFLSKFTDKLLAGGIGLFWQSGGMEEEYQELVEKYIASATAVERIEINARTFYYRMRL